MARTAGKHKGPANARKRASADIARKKAKQKRVNVLRRRMLILGGVLSVSYAAFGGWWLYGSGKIEQAMTVADMAFWSMTARAGFAVTQVTLEGREHVPLADLKSALAIAQGDPILAIDLPALRSRLLGLPEVRSVEITRMLPHEIRVVMQERKPIALWQRAGQYTVIDRDGIMLNRDMADMPKNLLVVVGDDAPKHIAALVSLLESAPSMREHVVSAVRVGQRRWNIVLKEGMTVMLPEDEMHAAWKKFVTLATNNALLSKAILTVDLRLEDRVFVTPESQPNTPKILVSAKDT